MAGQGPAGAAFILISALALAGCQDGFKNPFDGGDDPENTEEGAPQPTTQLVQEDVEAPDVFEVTDQGLWDGRPSLGGVWVAHSSVSGPGRVKVTNQKNGKTITSALFRRERENPGPSIQVSSGAAEALGMLAGQPAELRVVAIKREIVEVPAEAPEDGGEGAIAASTLDPIEGSPDTSETAATAAAAIEAAAPAEPAPGAAPTTSSSLSRPFIQIGIFSIEDNARSAAESLRAAGIIPIVKKRDSGDRSFYRVIIGPAQNADERKVLLEKVKSLGFSDAYSVTG